MYKTSKCFKQQMYITYSRVARILTQKSIKVTNTQLFSGLRAASRGSIQEEELCHTCFSKENQVQAYMHARINFHAYSWHKWITKTISRKKKEDYQRFTLNPWNEGTKLHKQSTGGCVHIEPATSSQDFKVASSFWATLFIARVSTCRTQQVWGKEWMQRLYSGLAISI
jgi:hypothetical protein